MQSRPIWSTLTTASRAALSTPSSMLSFHARNIPSISLEAYLLRILKYCPTTNDVFLSLLVYFDRMARIATEATGRTFVIDSYNIHRLVIAGVTVASKFFSDVFYTNSRYAKYPLPFFQVGGLPQAELNRLELQFLLLNDFRLTISEQEMQSYAEQLIMFSRTHALPPHQPQPQGAACGGGAASELTSRSSFLKALPFIDVLAQASVVDKLPVFACCQARWVSKHLFAEELACAAADLADPAIQSFACASSPRERRERCAYAAGRWGGKYPLAMLSAPSVSRACAVDERKDPQGSSYVLELAAG
ncbi:hypothetical protein EWM64_g9238 [Hericium alpestre]|uniref:Cyclin-like domain-containing protein n=1 Tax=Hericium alpestre TaxID=135208 RepID=A0A4Y9ZJZ2_9AGAM|nr:hypothetical protein EWM64_g9238 [Hericium alpestre]